MCLFFITDRSRLERKTVSSSDWQGTGRKLRFEVLDLCSIGIGYCVINETEGRNACPRSQPTNWMCRSVAKAMYGSTSGG